MPLNSVSTPLPDINTTESSGDGGTQFPEDDPLANEVTSTTLKIVTYTGAGIAMFGICLTLLSYIGYRKFHIKRPHIVMVNLCFCLFLYYLAFLISNPDRQSLEQYQSYICVFGAVVSHFSMLAAWFWLLVYWTLALVLYRRPMGGHISHFFIKAAFPAYGIAIVITVACAVTAGHSGELYEGAYYGPLCFVHNLYRYVGALLPVILIFLPMVVIFVILLRGVFFVDEERLKTSTTKRNVRRHFVRLSIITVLLGIVASCTFIQRRTSIYPTMIVFSATSSFLGLALMVLFCFHHEEIRDHWVSIIRGEDSSLRKHSISRSSKYEIGEIQSSTRKSSTLKGNTSSMLIESYGDERKSSTYRIVAKEDTDMSTLGLIEIPGTPCPERHDANENPSNDGAKVKRKKSDVSKVKHHDHGTKPSKEHKGGLAEIQENEPTSSKPSKKKPRSTSSPPISPRQRTTKRQQTSDAILVSSESDKNNASQGGKKRPSKRGNPTHRLSRFSRKSTSTIDEDTVQLTDFN